MRVVATYCSAEKRKDEALLPAARRYISERIEEAGRYAASEGLPFFILSGRFGLIPGEEPIPYYDHLLSEDEVEDMVERVSGALKRHGIREILFFTRDPSREPRLEPYLEVMARAASLRNVRLNLLPVGKAGGRGDGGGPVG